MTVTTETAPHRCEFPVQPPHGSFADPGPCDCGKTYVARIAEQRAAEAGLAVVHPEDLRAALTAKGPLPDAQYDRLAAAAGITPEGRRVICGCTQSPWLPPCEHNPRAGAGVTR